MESVECAQEPIPHQTCSLLYGEDTRACGRDCVHLSTTDTPKENLPGSQKRGRDRHFPSYTRCCETPKLSKKDVSLCRRLLLSKSVTDVKRSVSRTLGCTDVHTGRLSESPDDVLRCPISYSTLRSDLGTVCSMKRRLVFSQAVTSTLDDGRDGASPPLSEPDLDESIISGLLPSETPAISRGRDAFQTPLDHLVADLSESLSVLSTPSCTPISGLDASEDSGFGSLPLDGWEYGCNDSSFQEGVPQGTLSRDHHRSKLERQRRLSTLREGSQSDEDIKSQRMKRQSVKLEEEVFAETPPLTQLHDLSLTPALQAMEVLSRSFTLSHDLDQPISTQINLSHNLKQPITTRLPLSHLIGRKMGFGKMDVLMALHVRNLHHVLSYILQLLSAKDIHMCTQVCDFWSDIILQDRKANRRRRMYEREQKYAQEMGGSARVVDAETRLALARRLALGRVQAQAKTSSGTRTHTPAASGTQTHTPPSIKRQQFLQVAKTLFSDECLRPCPRCECPARCHSVKAQGVCTWSECAFNFCTSCLRAYHGSADCPRLPNMHTRRKGWSQLLPGSAQSKRNVKRL